MNELFQLVTLSVMMGLGLSGIVWLIGYLFSAAISVVFK